MYELNFHSEIMMINFSFCSKQGTGSPETSAAEETTEDRKNKDSMSWVKTTVVLFYLLIKLCG